MNFFKNGSTITGTKKHSIAALVFAVLTIAVIAVILALAFISGNFTLQLELISIPAILWFVTVFLTMKGLNSEEPKYAKIARPIVFISAVLVVGLCVMSVFSLIRSLL